MATATAVVIVGKLLLFKKKYKESEIYYTRGTIQDGSLGVTSKDVKILLESKESGAIS